MATTTREEEGIIELWNKYERILEAYDKEVKRRIELEDKLKEKTTRPRIAYPPRPCVEPFRSNPIVEIPDTTERPQFYTAAEFEEEKNRLYEIQIELNNQYKEKLRRTVMFFAYRIVCPKLYDQLARIFALRDEMKIDEGKLKSIIQKWKDRNDDIANMYISIT